MVAEPRRDVSKRSAAKNAGHSITDVARIWVRQAALPHATRVPQLRRIEAPGRRLHARPGFHVSVFRDLGGHARSWASILWPVRSAIGTTVAHIDARRRLPANLRLPKGAEIRADLGPPARPAARLLFLIRAVATKGRACIAHVVAGLGPLLSEYLNGEDGPVSLVQSPLPNGIPAWAAVSTAVQERPSGRFTLPLEAQLDISSHNQWDS
jgi:hypothetical protein